DPQQVAVDHQQEQQDGEPRCDAGDDLGWNPSIHLEPPGCLTTDVAPRGPNQTRVRTQTVTARSPGPAATTLHLAFRDEQRSSVAFSDDPHRCPGGGLLTLVDDVRYEILGPPLDIDAHLAGLARADRQH